MSEGKGFHVFIEGCAHMVRMDISSISGDQRIVDEQAEEQVFFASDGACLRALVFTSTLEISPDRFYQTEHGNTCREGNLVLRSVVVRGDLPDLENWLRSFAWYRVIAVGGKPDTSEVESLARGMVDGLINSKAHYIARIEGL